MYVICKYIKMLIYGAKLALLELYTFYKTINLIPTISLPIISSYWLYFTVLTGIWEISFISNQGTVQELSNFLLKTKTHTWTSKYPLVCLIPNRFAIIFYGEYAAYADREYKTKKDNWSRVIEGTHAGLCGLLSGFGLLSYQLQSPIAIVFINTAMGCQLMNSILYMSEYNIQTRTPGHINFDSNNFPLGKFWYKRPFMYINIMWTIMPIIVIASSLCDANHKHYH